MVITEGFIGLILGGVSSLLLSLIAYFLKLLVQDIRDLKKEQMNLRELCIWLKAEQGQLKKEVQNLFNQSKN
ncbi:hypothetical protein [Cecembia lonarensis]|uniref:Uncharacterized protein n=2 Tax=Cecembia TaxID=1187078 RepID=K1LED0_CECL9|nr:hypothetical protein [Cecembia lonarensis]EKB48703.1 hypothetical protein B879_02662 [Cecembia lonarensis LW9]